MPLRKLRASASVAWQGKAFRIAPAYSGGPLILAGYRYPVVVDLAGLTIPSQAIAALKEHDHARAVGVTSRIAVGETGLEIEGMLDAGCRDGEEIAAASRGGFAWEASIGATAGKLEEIAAGAAVEVNGRRFVGPILVARTATLEEISFVPRGADVGRTRVAIAAKLRGNAMTFDEWLVSLAFDKATLSADQLAGLQSAYDAMNPPAAEVEAAEGDPEEDEDEVPVAAAAKKPKAKRAATPPLDSILEAIRREQAAEAKRIAAVNRICAAHPDIAEKALTEGWTSDQAELHVLRASRGAGSGVGIATGKLPAGADDKTILRAALGQAIKAKGLDKDFTSDVLQVAHDRYRGRLGLGEVLVLAAMKNGYRGSHNGFKHDTANVLRAAFSTNDIADILSNTANKSLLAGFETADQTWRSISAIGRVTDFKTVTRYRMLDDSQFEQLPPSGEIKHGTLSDESFTNAADTYAKMYAITRRDIINDDLGALDAVPRKLGRGGANKLNDVFWTAFCTNSSFFADPSEHFYKGSDSVLASAGLAKVVAKFRVKTDNAGKPLAVEPKILLVPAALEVTALELMQSTNYNTGGSSTTDKVPNRNIWAGKFNIVVSPYLDNASYGNSAVIWYLLADPADIATIETVFLNGQETPTVEQADADFNTLGIQMRGYFDFGCTKQDARGGVKSKGAA